MRIPLQIVSRGIEPNDTIRAAMRKRAGSLDRLSDHVLRCRIVVAAEAPGPLTISVAANLVRPRGAEISVSLETDARGLPQAVRELFGTLKRRIERHVRQQRQAAALATTGETIAATNGVANGPEPALAVAAASGCGVDGRRPCRRHLEAMLP